jgi:hypothetical protein
MVRPSSLRALALGACLMAPLVLPSAASAQTPAAPAAQPKAAIENFTGFLFFCSPVATLAWTQAWCEAMKTEMTARAASAGRPVVLLNAGDGRAKHDERARAAGFDPKHALWVLLALKPRTTAPAGLDLDIRADGIAAGQPATAPSQTTTFSKSEILGAGIAPDEAAARGRRIMGTIMTALTTPMRPL